ncbi:MAG: hypothetical protein HFH55_08280 [Lachnospiraceae bacterium]|nr:hypothetical protein [Lachnospiraceae bacterium]
MEQICVLSFLGINSCLDLRRRRISLILTAFYAALGIFYLALDGQRLPLLLAGGVPGLLLLCVGKVSGGSLGLGDGLTVLVAGLYMGIWKALEWVTLAVLLAAVWAVVVMVCKKKGGKESFPFVPFLLAAYVIPLAVQVAEGVER